jgi:hypothetical protein
MNAAKLNFDGVQSQLCEQGATFSKILSLKDTNNVIIDVTGYDFKMQVRKNYSEDLITELSTDNGLIDIDSDGRVVLTLSATATALLAPGNYLYDIKMTDLSSVVTRILEGRFVVKAQITV